MSWVRVPHETALGVALPCCLFDLACFFLPSFSHLSLKHVQILHYLGEARKAYTRFFKKMINYYRPELTVHFEDRLLHFQPSGGWGPPGDFFGGGGH